MADIDSCKRTKCSGSWKGPHFRLWIWCILIKCFISLPCVFSKCLGVDIAVATYPNGDISVPYGTPLEIFCIAENYSSSDLVFTLGRRNLESEIVNSTTRRFYIKKPEKQVNTYYCNNKKASKICPVRVLVDSPPANVTDFNCLSKNMEILNCSWTSPPSYSIINYNLTFYANGNTVVPCIAQKLLNISTRYCSWNTSSQPRYRQQDAEQFFNLKGCNYFGCHIQNFTIDHFAIVKPDPPLELAVIKNGTHSVVLTWKVSNNIVDFLHCGVEHIIEYQIAKIDNRTVFHRVDASNLPLRNESYKFHLKNLPYAHMQYEVRVYIKSKKAEKREYWSDLSYFLFYTESEIPNRPPDTIAGAFHQSTFNNRRVIYVYWKQLEEYEEAGANFTYQVLVPQGNIKNSVFPEKNKSLSYVVLNTTLNALDITIFSINAIGSSHNSSYLYIPAERDTHSLKVSSFTKLAYENGTYELSWVGIKYINNYTLFWCQHNSTKICTGRMDFAVLDPSKNNHIIDLPKEYRYQFAISANNGSKTSGMVWAKCDISREGFAMYGFPVHLEYDAPGKSNATLKWVMDCALQDGIIMGYNISYCPIVQTSSNCDKSVEYKYVYIPDPKKMYVTIFNLLPFRTYQFSFALNTKYGLKNIENATARITTSEDTPTSPINVKINNVRNDSLIISWDPPLQRNGNIGKYVIYNFGKEFYVDKVSETDTSRREVKLTNLQGFANYSLTVQACNIPINLCSAILPNSAIFVRTAIGAPSKLKATVKNNPYKFQWEEPEIPGGTVDLYQIMTVKDDITLKITNVTDLSFSLTHCEDVVSTETYQVRAVNFDYDLYHGVLGDGNVTLPVRTNNESRSEYAGPWSEPSIVTCRSRDSLTFVLIFIPLILLGVVGYSSIKFYKKYRKMEDIKPVLPNGLGIPEKDISKYTFSGWNPTTKDEKPPSDEMLLLPNTKTTVPSSNATQKDENCASSEQTDSIVLSDSSAVQADRHLSTSEDGSNSSFHIEQESQKCNEENDTQEEESSAAGTETESSRENSPGLCDENFRINPISGYVQHTEKPAPIRNPPPEESSSGYVMASLPPMHTTNTTPINRIQTSSGYVAREEAQAMSMKILPKLGPTLPISNAPESLPYLLTLPLNGHLQSLKPNICIPPPTLPPVASGYVSTTDAVMNKHLNNMLSAGELAEEPAILDPGMSPDAYCRFSWSVDPANDNLHTLLAD